jgi:hypothetical protein
MLVKPKKMIIAINVPTVIDLTEFFSYCDANWDVTEKEGGLILSVSFEQFGLMEDRRYVYMVLAESVDYWGRHELDATVNVTWTKREPYIVAISVDCERMLTEEERRFQEGVLLLHSGENVYTCEITAEDRAEAEGIAMQAQMFFRNATSLNVEISKAVS